MSNRPATKFIAGLFDAYPLIAGLFGAGGTQPNLVRGGLSPGGMGGLNIYDIKQGSLKPFFDVEKNSFKGY